MKTCTKCGESLPRSAYQRRTLSKDGLMSQCRECVNARIRANYRKDPAKKIAQTRQYHLDNPEWSKAALRKSHVKNREARNGRVKARLATDSEFLAYRRNVGARSEQRRRAQIAGTEAATLTQSEYDRILAEFEGLCWICEEVPERLHWDHVHPLAKGGEHRPENLRPACSSCNVRKNGLWPFSEEDRQRIAEEVRALRASLSTRSEVGLEVIV